MQKLALAAVRFSLAVSLLTVSLSAISLLAVSLSSVNVFEVSVTGEEGGEGTAFRAVTSTAALACAGGSGVGSTGAAAAWRAAARTLLLCLSAGPR